MPTYHFECKNCKQITEENYKMSSRPDAIVCPNCSEVTEHVILGGTGFVLKGHGWGFDRYAGPSNFSNYGKNDE